MSGLWVKGLSALIGAVAITGGATYAKHRQQMKATAKERSGSAGLTSSALTLTGDIVDGIFRDEDIMNLVGDVVVKAFLHPEAIAALKDHFQHEFTENEATVAALKTFIVDEVILDKWVAEHLVKMSILLGGKLLEKPAVWPTGTCDLLQAAALEGLARDELLQAAKDHAYGAVASSRRTSASEP